MNDLIKGLVDEAIQFADDKWGYWEHDRRWQAEYNEKFAELIIRECATFARSYNMEKAERSFLIHQAIRQHFGL